MRRHYGAVRPRGSLLYKPPAPEILAPVFAAWPASQHCPVPPATLAQPLTVN